MTISKMYGTAVIFLNLLQGFHESGTRPLLRLPVVVILESGRDQENFVFIRPFRPAELAGDFHLALGVTSSEEYQNAVGASAFLLIRGWNPVPESDNLVGRRARLHNNGFHAGLIRTQFHAEHHRQKNNQKTHG